MQESTAVLCGPFKQYTGIYIACRGNQRIESFRQESAKLSFHCVYSPTSIHSYLNILRAT